MLLTRFHVIWNLFENLHGIPTDPRGFIIVPIPIPHQYPYPWEFPWEYPYPRQPCVPVWGLLKIVPRPGWPFRKKDAVITRTSVAKQRRNTSSQDFLLLRPKDVCLWIWRVIFSTIALDVNRAFRYYTNVPWFDCVHRKQWIKPLRKFGIFPECGSEVIFIIVIVIVIIIINELIMMA